MQDAQRSEKSLWIDEGEKGRVWSKVVAELWEAQMQKSGDLEPEGKKCWEWEKWRNELSRRQGSGHCKGQ